MNPDDQTQAQPEAGQDQGPEKAEPTPVAATPAVAKTVLEAGTLVTLDGREFELQYDTVVKFEVLPEDYEDDCEVEEPQPAAEAEAESDTGKTSESEAEGNDTAEAQPEAAPETETQKPIPSEEPAEPATAPAA